MVFMDIASRWVFLCSRSSTISSESRAVNAAVLHGAGFGLQASGRRPEGVEQSIEATNWSPKLEA
jgi:hypothetical protein